MTNQEYIEHQNRKTEKRPFLGRQWATKTQEGVEIPAKALERLRAKVRETFPEAHSKAEYEHVEMMTRPVPMVRKDGTEGTLIYATYDAPACGCKVTGNGSLQHPLETKLCALHAAAPDLLRGCQAAMAYLATPGSHQTNKDAAVEIIMAALKKAGAL